MDDAALVREFQSTGDATFFTRLVERHRDRALRIVAAGLAPGHRGEAEEITQDALLVASTPLDLVGPRSVRPVALSHGLPQSGRPEENGAPQVAPSFRRAARASTGTG